MDLHNHDYFQATIKIQDELMNAYFSDINELKFCHGHRGGTVIRDYIRRGKLLKEASPQFKSAIIIEPDGPSYTVIKFR
ncbi:MAG: hypothetical protein QF722_01295 [Candidatus Thalassarchaeaceae archaeon]|nr:hypothetical protein [Candidatus Thalassarchaeaceae archaeon]